MHIYTMREIYLYTYILYMHTLDSFMHSDIHGFINTHAYIHTQYHMAGTIAPKIIGGAGRLRYSRVGIATISAVTS